MNDKFSFKIKFDKKIIEFNSKSSGLIVNNKEYLATYDGILIYDKVKGLKANRVVCQFSTNTSTLIPSLKILDLPYNPYFDKRDVINSQNDITFYRKPSKLAAFYNRFSTDGVLIDKREKIIRKAVKFLLDTSSNKNFLQEEFFKGLNEKCEVLGEYNGVKIYDVNRGMPQLKHDLGIHVGVESVMVSTPLNKNSKKVVKLAKKLEKESGEKGTYKKNRVRFEKTDKILKILGANDN